MTSIEWPVWLKEEGLALLITQHLPEKILKVEETRFSSMENGQKEAMYRLSIHLPHFPLPFRRSS